MHEISAILLDQQRHADWLWITLGAAPLATIQPGQFVALRCATPGSADPLLRQPLFITVTEPQAHTGHVLVAPDHPAFPFLTGQPRGAQLDLLGPLGHGWSIDPTARTIALLGMAQAAAPLFALAHAAVRDGRSVSVLLGMDDHLAAPAPFLLPAAAEYNVVQADDAATAALAQLDDPLIRWADVIAIALPQPHWATIAQRVRTARLQWNRNFVQVAVLPPLACCVGACGVCVVETRQYPRLACVDGPVFDLRDLIR